MNALKIIATSFLLVFPLLTSGQNDPATLRTSPSVEVIAQWLHSGDAREIAWAAVFTLQERQVGLLPDLVYLEEQWQPLPHRDVYDFKAAPVSALSNDQRERRDAMTAVLDAIIQLNGNIPARDVLNLSNDFPAQSIVLLYRMSSQESDSALWSLYSEKAPATLYTQRSAASLLALYPPAGFAASLLTNTTIRAHVFVTLPEDSSFGEGGSVGDCMGAGLLTGIKTDWPTVGKYALRDARPGTGPPPFLTIAGAKPIDVVRVIVPVRQELPECGLFTSLNDSIRIALLAQLLNKQPEQIGIRTGVAPNLKVQNVMEFRSQLANFIKSEEDQVKKLKDDLAAKQLISPAEVESDAVLPRLLMLIDDSRSAKTFPLDLAFCQSEKVKCQIFGVGNFLN